MHGHISILKDGFIQEVIQMSADECMNIHRTGIYEYPKGQFHPNLGPSNRDFTIPITYAGWIGDSGDCEWRSTVRTGYLEIKLRHYRATVNLEDNSVTLQKGAKCVYSDLNCFDADSGRAVWSPTHQEACSEYSRDVLYQGAAVQIIAPDWSTNENRTFILVSNFNHVFALRLTRQFELCGRALWQTEHPRLSIDLNAPVHYYNMKLNTSGRDVDLLAYTNSKFLFVELTTASKLEALNQHSLYRRCLMERDMLLNRLAIARAAPDNVAYLLKNKPGYLARTMGSVLYIIQCQPVVVTLRRETNCFHEIPCTFKNESFFMSPISRILTRQANQIECSHLAPPVHLIDGAWIALQPEPVPVAPPTLLQPFVDQQLDFRHVRPISEGGLYTNDEVRDLQKALIFPSQRNVINHILMGRVAGEPLVSMGYDFTRMFSPPEVDKLTRNALKRVWDGFSSIGTFTSGLFGVYLAFRLIKYLLSVTVNALNIYSTMGCGFSLLASLWNALTLWVLRKSLVGNALTDFERAAAAETQRETTNARREPEYVEMRQWPRRPNHPPPPPPTSMPPPPPSFPPPSAPQPHDDHLAFRDTARLYPTLDLIAGNHREPAHSHASAIAHPYDNVPVSEEIEAGGDASSTSSVYLNRTRSHSAGDADTDHPSARRTDGGDADHPQGPASGSARPPVG